MHVKQAKLLFMAELIGMVCIKIGIFNISVFFKALSHTKCMGHIYGDASAVPACIVAMLLLLMIT
jgi:hypothetical protein